MVALASLGAGKKGRPPKTLWQVLAHDSKYWLYLQYSCCLNPFATMPAPRPSLRLASHLPASIAGVWHADALGGSTQRVLPTGYAALDAELSFSHADDPRQPLAEVQRGNPHYDDPQKRLIAATVAGEIGRAHV